MNLPLAGGLWLQVTGAFHDYWTALLHPNFLHPALIFIFPILLWFGALWGKRQMSIRHSNLEPHQSIVSWSLLVALAYAALVLCLGNFTTALMVPQVPQSTVQHLITTRNICLINDSSGSMLTKLLDGVKDVSDDEAKADNDPTAVVVDSGTNNKTFVGHAKPEDENAPMTRIKAAQLASRYLIRHRMTSDPFNTDRFCIFRFDDDLYELAPLTNDKLALLLRTTHITENVGGGTNFVVALKKAYDYLLANTGPASTRVLVMNTDGYDSIDPEKRKELIKLYIDAKIKFYVIGLGEGWKEQADGTKMDLQKFAEELNQADPTSGFVYRASNPGQMQKAMEAIDAQERSQEVWETLDTSRDVAYVFIIGAIACGIIFLGLASLAGRNP